MIEMINRIDQIAAMLCLMIGLVIGGVLAHWWDAGEISRLQTQVNTLKNQRDSDITAANEAALKRVNAANAKASSLQTALEITEHRLSITQTEMQREIKRNTTGRACLNSRTVSLLNNQTTRNPAASLPTAASESVTDSADVATDTDVANWASLAITQYGTCKARLDALIAWHGVKND